MEQWPKKCMLYYWYCWVLICSLLVCTFEGEVKKGNWTVSWQNFGTTLSAQVSEGEGAVILRKLTHAQKDINSQNFALKCFQPHRSPDRLQHLPQSCHSHDDNTTLLSVLANWWINARKLWHRPDYLSKSVTCLMAEESKRFAKIA